MFLSRLNGEIVLRFAFAMAATSFSATCLAGILSPRTYPASAIIGPINHALPARSFDEDPISYRPDKTAAEFWKEYDRTKGTGAP
jgi:hypothetical protein